MGDKALFAEWKGEMKGMAGRIERVRGELRRRVRPALRARLPLLLLFRALSALKKKGRR